MYYLKRYMATERAFLIRSFIYLFYGLWGGIHNILWSAKHIEDTVHSSFYELSYNSYSSNYNKCNRSCSVGIYLYWNAWNEQTPVWMWLSPRGQAPNTQEDVGACQSSQAQTVLPVSAAGCIFHEVQRRHWASLQDVILSLCLSPFPSVSVLLMV